tara:strand:- start:4304 stop:5401 length:1098 start_codon:yes stop_codon:yes gene_type:complete
MKSKIILFMPHIDIGGVEKNFFLISNFLAKKRNNIVVLTISKKSKKFFNKNINFITFKSNFLEKISKRSKYILSLLLLTKEVLINKNLLVVSFQANVYCGLLSKLLGFKLIIRSNTSPDGWSKNIMKKFLYKMSLKAANKVIVNSNDFKKKIKKIFDVNAECIYNPLNKKEIINLSKKSVNFNFFNKKYLNVINVGRLEDQKDQMTLLKSISFLKKKMKIKLLIIGNGSMEKKLKYYIYKNDLDKNVKILHNISNPFPYFVKSDLFVLSSVFEGLPNVLLEALTLNKFVISTKCSTGPSEILSKGKGGILVPINDYKNLANKIVFFKRNNKNLKKKLLFAKKNLKRFDLNQNLNKFLRIVDKIDV